jgi:hypothetical protein
MWRLRTLSEMFYERFWLKLARYASSGTRIRQNKRGVLVMGRQFTSGSYVQIEAQLLGSDAKPLPETAKPKLTLTLPADIGKEPAKDSREMQPKSPSKDNNGWFYARVQARNVGDHKVQLSIPGSSDTLEGKFTVKESNPELDNTAPDVDALKRVSTEFDKVSKRLKPDESDRLRRALSPALEGETVPRLTLERLTEAGTIPPCLQTQTRTERTRGAVEDLWDKGINLGKVPEWMSPRWWFVVRLLTLLVGVPLTGLAFLTFAIGLVLRLTSKGDGGPGAYLASTGVLLAFVILLVLTGGVLFLSLVGTGNLPSLGVKPLVLPYVLLAVVGMLSLEWLVRKLIKLA